MDSPTPAPAASHRRASTANNPPINIPTATPSFITMVRAARIMNTPTTPASAMQKASFYDSIVDKIRDGLAEDSAVSEAVEEVAQRTVAAGSHSRRSSSFAGAPPGMARRSSMQAGAAAAANRPSTESQPIAPEQPTLEQTAPAQPSRLKGLFHNIIRPSIQKGAEQAKGQKPLRSAPATKLSDERKSVTIKEAHDLGNANAEDDNEEEEDEDEQASGVSMTQLRMMHRKLMMVVDDYDRVTRERNEEHERDLLRSYRSTLESVEEATRKAMMDEYGKLIDHNGCNAKISQLSKENEIMKEETKRIVNMNVDLMNQLTKLKVFKSNAQSEHTLMIKQLAKRRMRCRMLRRKLAELQGDQLPGDESGVESEAGRVRSNTMAWKRSAGLVRGMLSDAERTVVQKSDGEEFSSEYDTNGGGREMASGEEGSSLEEREYTDYDSEEEDFDQEEESERWSAEKKKRARPIWNPSTITNLLSQKAPPSVIHTGDGPGIPYDPAMEEALVSKTPRPESALSDIDDRRERRHRKCRQENQRLRDMISKEKSLRKSLLATSVNRQQSISQLMNVLQECLYEARLPSSIGMGKPATGRSDISLAIQIPTPAVLPDADDSLDMTTANDPEKKQLLLDSLERNGSLIRNILTALQSAEPFHSGRQRPGSAPARSGTKGMKPLSANGERETRDDRFQDGSEMEPGDVTSSFELDPRTHTRDYGMSTYTFEPLKADSSSETGTRAGGDPPPSIIYNQQVAWAAESSQKPPPAPPIPTHQHHYQTSAVPAEADTVARWVQRVRTRPQSAPISRHGALGADLERLQASGREAAEVVAVMGNGLESGGVRGTDPQFEALLEQIVQRESQRRMEKGGGVGGRGGRVAVQKMAVATSRLRHASPIIGADRGGSAGRWATASGAGHTGSRVRPSSAPVRGSAGKRPSSASLRKVGGVRVSGEDKGEWVVSGISLG
ncbi:hypothetical protein HDV00_001460 [Rhizophlyctis rosea]|nr:hypothetical protein HDV00_001460 [Rhizophlyctis rosea]